ncbi:hypothetical protein LUZ60_014192 [Juncus effusus]|nr:hypothetical protein LUZ60_014192 [Juncus effusus]
MPNISIMSCSNFTILFLHFLTAIVPTLVHGSSKNLAHIHLYMHDKLSSPNATVTKVVNGSKPIPTLPSLNFGDIIVYDDLLTEGPSPDSTPIGRGQAFYPVADQNKPALLIVMNIILTSGEYNGSSIAVMGTDYIFAPVRELSVIGGTGQFRMARGYVIWKTFSFNTTSGDAVLELDIYAKKTKTY